MISATELRACIDGRLQAYEAANGVGPDAYCEAAASHSMADGKFLQALAVMRRSGILSANQFEARSLNACARLEAQALDFGQGRAWGLGFPWRDMTAAEPFLITSAVVTRGLLDARTEGVAAPALAGLLEQATAGLRSWFSELSLPTPDGGLAVPAYSPSIREPIYNAAAYASSTLHLCAAAQPGTAGQAPATAPLLEWVRTRRVAGLGWKYAADNPVVDLLHQQYILNALADVDGIASVESEALEMVGQFAGPCCFADAIRCVAGPDAQLRDIPWLRPLGSGQIELLPKPARLWSLGELLVLVARLGGGATRPDAWMRLGTRLAETIVQRLNDPADAEGTYPRHAMHALHGLACQLALLRKRAQDRKSAAEAGQ